LVTFDLKQLVGQSDSADVTIEAQGEKIPAHHCILAARSGFFSGLFRRSNNSTHTTDLPAQLFRKILLFMYSADNVAFSAVDCVWMMSEAVDFYLLDCGSPNHWLQLALKRTNSSNCIAVYETAVQLRVQSSALSQHIFRIIERNFKELEACIEEMENVDVKIELLNQVAKLKQGSS
jgi:hypothetical protein